MGLYYSSQKIPENNDIILVCLVLYYCLFFWVKRPIILVLLIIVETYLTLLLISVFKYKLIKSERKFTSSRVLCPRTHVPNFGIFHLPIQKGYH